PDVGVQESHESTTLHRNFATNLLPSIEQLLTVRQVAQLFGVCTATVYKWAAHGALPHVRIVNLIRVRPQELSLFHLSAMEAIAGARRVTSVFEFKNISVKFRRASEPAETSEDASPRRSLQTPSQALRGGRFA